MAVSKCRLVLVDVPGNTIPLRLVQPEVGWCVSCIRGVYILSGGGEQYRRCCDAFMAVDGVNAPIE